MAADASNALPVPDEFLHRKRLSQLSTGLHGCINQNLIEHCTARGVPLNSITRRWRGAGEDKVTEVKGEGENWRAVGGPELVQQPPTLEPGNPRLLMDFAISRSLVRPSRLLSSSCSSACTFDSPFLESSKRCSGRCWEPRESGCYGRWPKRWQR